jgi:hypothetical protein
MEVQLMEEKGWNQTHPPQKNPDKGEKANSMSLMGTA